jgi:hypothetical protein
MKDKPFDDLVRKKMFDHESPVPANMWERIASNKKNRKRGFKLPLYFLVTALLLIGFANGYSFLFTSKAKNKVAVTEGGMHTPSVQGKRAAPHNKETGNSVSLADNKHIRTGTAKAVFIKDKQPEKQSSKAKDVKKRKQRSGLPQQFTPDALNIPTAAADNSRTVGETDSISKSLANSAAKNSVIAKQDSTSLSQKNTSPTNNEKASVEIYASPDMPVNVIRSMDKSYENVLKRSGNMQLSYTVGVRVRYEITEKIAAKIGVQYTQVNERMAVSDSVVSNTFVSKNRYKNISVPLLITYKGNWFGTIRMSVNTGVVLDIAHRFKGVIPSFFGEPVDIAANNVYDRNASARLYLSMDVSKKIYPGMELFAEPWFSYRLKNMPTQFYGFNQKIHTSGIAFGLRYHLFKNED